MITITIQDLKQKGAKAIPDDQPVYLIVNSKPKSVLVPVAEYEMLKEAMRELEDIKIIEERKGERLISFEDVLPRE